MAKWGNSRFPRLKAGLITAFAVIVLSATLYTSFKPKPASAQCVCGVICTMAGSGIGRAILTIMNSEIVVEIYNLYTELSELYDSLVTEFNSVISGALDEAEDNLDTWMENFVAYDLTPAMKQRTDQLNTLMIDKSRTMNSMRDGQQQSKVLRQIQKIQSEAFVENTPNPATCIAGTFAGGVMRARTISNAMEQALPLQNMGAGGNYFPIAYLQSHPDRFARSSTAPGQEFFVAQFLGRGGQYCADYVIDIEEDDYLAAAAGGNALYQKARAHNYMNKYCNEDSNGGEGCTADAAMKDMDILVDETLFKDDTIDFEAEATLDAVNDLITNLIEPTVPNLISPSSFRLPEVREQMLDRRSIRAQKTLAKKVIYDVAARRAPGSRIGPYVESLRSAAGVNLDEISENPSLNEVINALTTERFWTGVYNLQNVQGPEQVTHEKLAIQAIEIMQLSDYLDMIDNLSLLLAAQVANETGELGDSGGRDNALVGGGRAAP